MVKRKRYIFLIGLMLGWLPMVSLAVEATRTESSDPGQPAASLLKSGIVEEVSPGDLDYYGFTEFDGGGEDRFPIRARLRVDAYYDSNIYLTDSSRTDDFIWEFTPDIYYETGDGKSDHYFTFGYDPTFQVFLDNSSENAANHAGYAKYIYNGDKLRFIASHSSASVTGANKDIGQRVTRDEHRTRLSADYDVTEKINLEAEATQSLRFYETLNNYHDWTGSVFALYQVLPKLKIGVGPKIGFVDIEKGPNQTYQQALFRFVYEATEKFKIDGSAGADFRQYEGPLGWEDRVTPAASLGFAWMPYDGTDISGSIYRNISPSVSILGSDYVATGIRMEFRQRFLRKFHYNLSGSFENAEYRPTLAGTVNNREDNYFQVRTGVDYQVFKYGSVSLYYQFEDNGSENSPSDFNRHVAGIQLNLQY